MAPWMILLIGGVMIWLGLKNKATDFVNALLSSASPYGGNTGNNAANPPQSGDNQGAPAATGQGTAAV